MVVDELIAFLKEKMYAQDAMFSTLVIDRFFRILSDSKSLLSINADGSFVLSLIFFKMVEALKIKEIDQMIETFQKDIHSPQPVSSQPTSIPQQSQVVSQNFSQASEVVQVEEKVQNISNKVDDSFAIFSQLVANIKDRNFKLGDCFANSVKFISYENNLLTWESCADEECKKDLKHGYSAIKQLVRELYGFSTQIKGVACSSEVKVEPKMEPTPPQTPSSIQEEQQSPSMVEDVEIGGSSSCVTHCDGVDREEPKEIDGVEIMQEPMVQQAIELFEAKKVTIQSKI
jgi:DNA polymerase-3 subunit gamma/tau